MQWETVIGLEVHAQLACESKIFSGAATAFGAEPNTQACAVDLGLPGTLPVLNEQAVDFALMFGLAIDAQIDSSCVFARKNYFYPDLPKGYQISQFDHPIVGRGDLSIQLEDGSDRVIGITRAHLEEDAGKSLHGAAPGCSGIDLNRAGTPLLEIVSEPDIRSAEETICYLRSLQQLVRYLGISDGNMQEGSFRCDVNISLRPKGEEQFGTRAEIKNLNSFRFIQQAIAFETQRQADILESGGKVVQETRLYDPDRDETRSMRSKEEAFDYRYFPDPDLLPVEISAERMADAREKLPELPWVRKERFIEKLGLKSMDAHKLTQQKATADFFESVLKKTNAEAKLAANWINGELSAQLNKQQLSIEQSQISATCLGALLNRIVDNTLSSSAAKTVFLALWEGTDNVDQVIEAKGLKQVSDSSELEALLDEIIANNPSQVEEFKAGKTKLMAFFVGQMMKATQGKANPKVVTQLIQKKLRAL
jgi:aspartyl-tRNA(Asn)/glutamyl-tRNA(Gln) amidotransferase subunit B